MHSPFHSLKKPAVRHERVFWSFAVGGILALLVMAALPGLLFGILSPRFPVLQPFLPQLLLVGHLGAFFADGMLGALLLGLGRRAQLGFGIGFLGPAYLLKKTFFFVRFLPATVGPVELLLYPTGMFGLGFALAALVGSLITGYSVKSTLRIMGVSSLAGILGGGVLILPFLLAVPASAARLDSLLTTAGTLVGFLIPHFGMGLALKDCRE